MPVEYRKGNLFSVEEGVSLAHGCNTRGVMGAGIAKQFRDRYPEMFTHYKFRCDQKLLWPGRSFVWKGKNKTGTVENRWIINLATQDNLGACARYEWIEASIEDALNTLGESVEAIAMPQIGCGIGGLEWEKVKAIIEKIGKVTETRIVVYSL
jgi:O-acetyl-ADP-ribose deacetylase (regulator of RNase III)